MREITRYTCCCGLVVLLPRLVRLDDPICPGTIANLDVFFLGPQYAVYC